MKIDEYKKLRQGFIVALDEVKKKAMFISTVRWITFLLSVAFIVLGVYVSWLFYIMTLVTTFVFVGYVIYHNKIDVCISKLNYEIGTVDFYIARSNNDWKIMGDKGLEFLDKNEYYQSDLDIFGPCSLYQYISTAKTPFGKKFLATSLKNFEFSDLKKRQEAINELANKTDAYLEIDCASRMYNYHNNRNTTIPALEKMDSRMKDKVNYSKLYMLIAIGAPLSLLITLILACFRIVDFRIPILLVLFNLTSIFFYRHVINNTMNDIFEINQTLESYMPFLKYLDFDFKSELLNEYKVDLKKDKESLDSFHKRSGIINMRRSVIFSLLANGIFQFDYWCLLIYASWQKKYSTSILKTLHVIGHLEELNSLAVINRVKETVTIGEYSEALNATNLLHPLLDEKNAIGNDFSLSGLDVITGSNMSGKTTFMRTIGLNLILFLAGSGVCADSFSASYYKLFTSMRATDDISEGISTFYAEILRIKDMLNYVNSNNKTLVLIDEIFKGTNTHDRILGARGAINRLKKDNVIGIIATHDNELCSEVSENYHFEEHYDGDNILFDYKIKKGIAITTNAKHLMRIAGIIGEE